jgi:hypothetical protein
MADTLKVNKNAPLTPTVKTGDTSTLASTLAALGITSIPTASSSGSSSTTVKNPPSSQKDITKYTPAAPGAPASDATNINSIWRSITGQDPTDKEQNAIVAAINAALKIHPTLTQSSGGVNASGGAADTLTTTKGADVNEVVRQQALQAPGTSDFQAATTYYDALLSAIKGPFGGGY